MPVLPVETIQSKMDILANFRLPAVAVFAKAGVFRGEKFRNGEDNNEVNS